MATGKQSRWAKTAPPRMVNLARLSSEQKKPKKVTDSGFIFVNKK